MHWITFIMLLLCLSSCHDFVKIIKSRLIKNSDNILPIIHSLETVDLIFIFALFAMQILSLFCIDAHNVSMLHLIKKIAIFWFNFGLGVFLLYTVSNNTKPEEYSKSLTYLKRGLIFAGALFLIDHLLHHGIFSLIMPNLILNNSIGYNISQSHQGQIFCTIICWALFADCVIKKDYRNFILVFISVLIIAILPFMFYRLNYNAPLGLFLVLCFFVFSFFVKKSIKIFSVLLFLFIALLVPVLFVLIGQDWLYNIPFIIKDSLLHRFCIWHYYGHKILENFIFGHWFNVSEFFYNFDHVACNIIPYFKGMHPDLVANGYHPHNITMQMMLEYGIFGLVWLLIFGIYLILKLEPKPAIIIRKHTMKVLRTQVLLKNTMLSAFFTILLFLAMAVNIWSGWAICAIMLTFCLFKMVVLNTKFEK